MSGKVMVKLKEVHGIAGEVVIDESMIGSLDQELADDIASAVVWAVYGMIGNRRLKETLSSWGVGGLDG